VTFAAVLRGGTRIAACALVLALPAKALEVPSAPKGRVSDYASLLSPDAIARIDSKIAAHEAQSSDQIAVAIFPSLEGESLEDFSIQLARQWKIGSKEHDNGAILLLFVQDRQMRLEVGYGLEGRLTDAMSSRILRNILAPRFREGDFDGGVERAVDAIIEVIRGEYQAPPEETKQKSPAGTILFWIFILLLFYLMSRAPRQYWSNMGGPVSGRRAGWTRRRSVPPWWWGGGGGFGGGGFGGGGFGGGGFGGGGGGFGGGGASGKW
jgi:uncharacterized protein